MVGGIWGDGAQRKGHVNIGSRSGPMNNRPVTKQMLLPTSSMPFSSPASDPLPCSFRFELFSRDIGGNSRHRSNTATISTAPASLAEHSSPSPIQGLLKTTFSTPAEAGSMSDDASMSPMEVRGYRKLLISTRGTQTGLPNGRSHSSSVLTTLVTDNRASVQTVDTP